MKPSSRINNFYGEYTGEGWIPAPTEIVYPKYPEKKSSDFNGWPYGNFGKWVNSGGYDYSQKSMKPLSGSQIPRLGAMASGVPPPPPPPKPFSIFDDNFKKL